jgi:hypothetical protein
MILIELSSIVNMPQLSFYQGLVIYLQALTTPTSLLVSIPSAALHTYNDLKH